MRSQVERVADGALSATIWADGHVDIHVIPGGFQGPQTSAALRKLADFIDSGEWVSDAQRSLPNDIREALEHDRRRRLAEAPPPPPIP